MRIDIMAQYNIDLHMYYITETGIICSSVSWVGNCGTILGECTSHPDNLIPDLVCFPFGREHIKCAASSINATM